MSADVGAGSLLVATPALRDPHFRRSVVYVIAHNASGTIGVVLNRRSDTAVQTVLPRWAPLASKPAAVYLGGPVQTDAAMAVAVLRADEPSSAAPAPAAPGIQRVTEPVDGPVVLLNLDADPGEVALSLRGLRVFVGHAGWGEGQLDDEIEEGAWRLVAGQPEDLLAGPSVDLWFRVLRRQGWPSALDAYYPATPDSN